MPPLAHLQLPFIVTLLLLLLFAKVLGELFKRIGVPSMVGELMALVIANIALTRNLIDPNLFSILVLIALSTTLITPLLLKYAFRFAEQHQHEAGK
ncbi:MAG: hypothetical protein JXA23_10770 [Bacteroidales bacterium]|nr:hypothetical protein [Bacteroidales bacterium]